MRIIEATIFWNEDHFFKEKVENALAYAERLVIAEASESFSGLVNRPFRAKSLLDKLSPATQRRVDILELAKIEGSDAWEREAFVRNAPFQFIEANRKDDEFLILVQDFDEFFNWRKLKALQSLFALDANRDVLHLNYYCSYYYLNNLILSPEDHYVWRQAVVARYKYIKSAHTTLTALRTENCNLLSKERFGWHHSYLGSKNFIKEKIRSFSHYNDTGVKDISDTRVSEVLTSGADLFDRPFIFEKRADYREIGIPELINREDLYFPGTYTPSTNPLNRFLNFFGK